MFDPSRDQVREFFFETWRKLQAGEALSGMEALALEIVLLHPEYHAVHEAADRHRQRDSFRERRQSTPFLHLSLRRALEDELSIDQPRGIVARFAALSARHGERRAALHDAIECLAEMVWRAQRERAEPDGAAYLECLEVRARR